MPERLCEWIRGKRGAAKPEVAYLSIDNCPRALPGCWGGDNIRVVRHAFQGKTEMRIHVNVAVGGRGNG
jgi:hypothetical protein